MTWLPDDGPPQLTATIGAASPGAPVADKGASNVVVQQVHLAPTAGQPQLDTLTVSATGGHPDIDFTAVKVFKDVNFNGQFDGTDTVLGSGTFDSSGQAVLSLDSGLVVATSTDIAIAVDINSSLSAGVALPSSPWSLLLIVFIPVFVLARRQRATMALALCLVVGGCGGGGANDDDDQSQSDTDNYLGGDNGDSDSGDDGDVQPVDSVTFTFAVTSATVNRHCDWLAS